MKPMKYAVVKIGGSQYKVSEGDKLEVNRLAEKEGQTLKFEEVLLAKDGEKLLIGEPLVKGASVSAKIEKNFLGEKVHVFKFKAKTGYRRKTGFRPQLTRLQIEKIAL